MKSNFHVHVSLHCSCLLWHDRCLCEICVPLKWSTSLTRTRAASPTSMFTATCWQRVASRAAASTACRAIASWWCTTCAWCELSPLCRCTSIHFSSASSLPTPPGWPLSPRQVHLSRTACHVQNKQKCSFVHFPTCGRFFLSLWSLYLPFYVILHNIMAT